MTKQTKARKTKRVSLYPQVWVWGKIWHYKKSAYAMTKVYGTWEALVVDHPTAKAKVSEAIWTK